MTPEQFIAKWKPVMLTEKSASQQYFIDLCHLLGEPTPAEADPTGNTYTFEKGAMKATGGNGWADVWRQGIFGWEYKRKGKELDAAYLQLKLYADALENRPRYTPSTTFRTFPFPTGLSPNQPAQACKFNPHAQAIAAAARQLDELRQGWLVPAELVDRVPEVVEGYPNRIVPKNAAAAAELKKRTFFSLYNANPSWLQHANRDLDQAVAAAYGWPWPIEDEDVLKHLFALNAERASYTRQERDLHA